MSLRHFLLAGVFAFTAAHAQPAAPRARITETLRLDATAEDFSTVGRVYVGPHKQMVVTLPQDRQIRWYDSLGKKIGVLGRNGQGPGEFMSIGAAGWIADTLWLHDGALRRTTFVAPDAKLLRTVALPAQMTMAQKAGDAPSPMMGGAPLAFFADGSSIVGGFTMINGPNGRQSASEMRVARMSASGAAIAVHTPQSFNDPRWALDIAGFQNVIPFKMPPQTTGSFDGARIATLWADIAGDTGSFTVTLMKAGGEQIFSRAYPFKGSPIPQRAIDSALAAFLPKPGQPTEGPSDLGQRFQNAAKSKVPAAYIPATGILLGMDNTVWIPMRASPEGREVLVLDGRGTPIASVVLPPRTILRQATIETLWATQTDADGLASMVRYKVTGIACGAACR